MEQLLHQNVAGVPRSPGLVLGPQGLQSHPRADAHLRVVHPGVEPILDLRKTLRAVVTASTDEFDWWTSVSSATSSSSRAVESRRAAIAVLDRHL